MVADALSRKERVKPRQVRALAMTIHFGVRGMILAAQGEAFKQENVLSERLHGEGKASKAFGFIATARDTRMEVDKITMDFITKLPNTKSGHDTIWVIVDMLTKSAYFLAMQEDYSTERLTSERTIQTLEDMLRARVIDFGGNWDVHLPLAGFSYNNSYHSSIRYAPFEALYGRKCRSPVLWAEIGESSLIGPELVQEITRKVVLIKEKLKAAKDHQKSYADNRHKPLKFEVGVKVLLKKVNVRHEHDTFHVSNLKKCLADANLHVSLDETKINKTLHFVKKPVEIMDREVKTLKRSKILIAKVRWNSKRDPEFTWEHEDHTKARYPQLFVANACESSS
ncbi:putative reverse transcriptase domain-containing protein [Tanacetum coccineum]|uniref:Reverse transcriptase domain-containing protein n=1 Tax=Tanacetum coccineum TaxID=301880 RepID=A0ABQ4XME3_9ASTR